MQIVKTRKIECDCGENVFEMLGTLKQVRVDAKKHGWYYSRFSRWVCPHCQNEQQREWVGMVQCPID